MKLDEVRNLIRKGSRRNDAFAQQFEADARGNLEAFKNKYFANDPETLQNLDQWSYQLTSHQYGTTGVLTSGGGCTTVTYYASDPYSGSGGAQTP